MNNLNLTGNYRIRSDYMHIYVIKAYNHAKRISFAIPATKMAITQSDV